MTNPTRGAPLAVLTAVALLSACASVAPPPPVTVAAAARTSQYNARLKVSLDSPEVRARTKVLLAFARPDCLRLEIPGPSGARLIAVVRQEELVAVFPGEQAVFRGRASSSDFHALLGVALAPAELMDLLVGTPTPQLLRYRAWWGAALPRRLEATLADGGRLRVWVEEGGAVELVPPLAFAEPAHPGYRTLTAEEARRLWAR